jgi:hypothetical protein
VFYSGEHGCSEHSKTERDVLATWK